MERERARQGNARLPRWDAPHAHRADDIAAATLAGITGFRDPALRLLAAHTVEQIDTRAIKVAAVLELVDRGWTYRRIASVIGVGKSRAYALAKSGREKATP